MELEAGRQHLIRCVHAPLTIIGAQTVLLRSRMMRSNPWIQGMLARCPRLKVAVALANKTARISWAVMAKAEPYRGAAMA